LDGKGDLFIGGLPQRLECQRHGLVELLTSQNHPLMLGIDAMVYKGNLEIAVLEAISTSWSRVCRRLALDRQYSVAMFQKWKGIAQTLGISSMFGEEEFVRATHDCAGEYLKFFAGRDDAASDLIKATGMIVAEFEAGTLESRKMFEAIAALHETYVGPPNAG
jgi:hypothetical protein